MRSKITRSSALVGGEIIVYMHRATNPPNKVVEKSIRELLVKYPAMQKL